MDTVGRIEEEMQLFASTFLGADGKELRKQSVDTVREYDEAMSAWEQLRDEGELLCRWFRFAQLAKGKKFRP